MMSELRSRYLHELPPSLARSIKDQGEKPNGWYCGCIAVTIEDGLRSEIVLCRYHEGYEDGLEVQQ